MGVILPTQPPTYHMYS